VRRVIEGSLGNPLPPPVKRDLHPFLRFNNINTISLRVITVIITKKIMKTKSLINVKDTKKKSTLSNDVFLLNKIVNNSIALNIKTEKKNMMNRNSVTNNRLNDNSSNNNLGLQSSLADGS
jgi:hypothetical protein